jgi:hypothetical protein
MPPPAALADAATRPKKKVSPNMDPMRLLSRSGKSATPYSFSPGRGLRLAGFSSGRKPASGAYMA